MRPAFENLSARKGFVQPLHRIAAQTREQHEVRTAGDDVDRVDLQQLHAFDRGH